MPLAIQRYIYLTDDRDDALEVTERIRYLGRVVAALMSDTQELDGPYLVDRPFPDEPSLEVLLEGALVGDPHKIAERMAAEIRALRVTHYSCFMCLPGLDAGRARFSRVSSNRCGRSIPGSKTGASSRRRSASSFALTCPPSWRRSDVCPTTRRRSCWRVPPTGSIWRKRSSRA